MLRGELAGRLSVGQRVTLNGFTRLIDKKDSDESNFYSIVFNIISIEAEEGDADEIQFSDEDIEEMEEIAKNPNLFDDIVQSIAPTIYGHEDVKRGIALQLFGGTQKRSQDGTIKRGDIHILLVGDPGVSKSQLLKYTSGICPRTVMTSGKSATAAGLTATAVKDESTGKWTIEAGALVLADCGMCCIDEIDKMNSNDRSSLHDAIEAQVVRVSKAGITVELKSKCSVLAAANPRYGRFDPDESIVSQINLSDALLSRFDLIFVMRDVPNMELDSEISDRILRTHMVGQVDACPNYDGEVDVQRILEENRFIKPIYDPETLRKYVAYGKKFTPVMGRAVYRILQESYLRVRSKYIETGKVAITARQLEGYIRLAEASAKLHLRNTITTEDAQLASKIIEDYLEKVGNQGGGVDIDSIVASASNKDRTNIALIEDAIYENPNGLAAGMSMEELIVTLSKNGLTEADVRSAVKIMERKDKLYRPDRTKEVYKLKGMK